LLVLVAASLRAPRADRTRATAILWGGWLLVGGAVLSAMQGIVHAYYTATLAPAIAALTAAGAAALWQRSRQRRDSAPARLAAATMAAASGAWAFVLLERTPDWLPWLRWIVLLGSVAAALALACAAVPPLIAAAAARFRRRSGGPGTPNAVHAPGRPGRHSMRTTALASGVA